MAKQKSNSASKKQVENLVKVTDKNRKMCVIMGREMLAYGTSGKAFTLLGSFHIRPRLIAKTNLIANGEKVCYCHVEEERDEYADKFKSVIDWLIKKEQLYINPETKLITYE